MARRSGKPIRVPWKLTKPTRDLCVTVPVYMAFCGMVAALRSWSLPDSKFIVIACVQEDYYFPVYSEAAAVFASGLSEDEGFRHYVYEWGDRHQYRDQMEALKTERAIFIAPPGKELDDDAWLFADAVVDIPVRTRSHAEAALRRCGLPVADRDVELLVSEPWSRLHRAFQDRRRPALALERLRRHPRAAKASPETKPIGPTLADMHGFGPVVDWGNDLAVDLADYKAGNIPWEDVDAGVLISGPPGTGKTMFAGALASTCGVPIVYGSVSRWQEAGSLDNHLKAMRATFNEAKEKAPSILFVDEVDTFGDRADSDRNRGYMRGATAGFLELLDGFNRRKGVVVVAACNHPEQLDPAIRRAGRLDRHFEIMLPDAQSRLAILRYHSGVELDGSQAEQFAIATEGFSGADIGQLVRDAKRVARRRRQSLSAGQIIEELRPLSALPDELIRSIAVHEAGHALVAIETGYGEICRVKIASYKVQGSYREMGSVEYGMPLVKRRTRADYLNQIAVFLGGIAAESEVFNSFADGASGADTSDLNIATRLGTLLEASLGMGHTLVVEDQHPSRLERLRDYDSGLRRRVHDVIASEFERARAIIRDRRVALDEIVERLSDAKTMSGDEVLEIVQRHRKPKVSLAKPSRGMEA